MGTIQAAEQPLSKIFSSAYSYEIPFYQRPYAWTDEQVEHLFDDLYDVYGEEQEDNQAQEDYFLGSIVLVKKEGAPHAVVIDGQQRLTTLTILLAALGSRICDHTWQNSFKKFVLEPGDPSEGLEPGPRLLLREQDRAFFKQYVQKYCFEDLHARDPGTLANEAQRNIRLNSELLLRRLEEKFGEDQERLQDFGSFLVRRCFLVVVSTLNRDVAFRVFSTLNSRGLPLGTSDILKAEIIGKITPDRQEEVSEKWEELEDEVTPKKFEQLFSHIRMIYTKRKAPRNILDEFRDKVLKDVSMEDFIDKIFMPYAQDYRGAILSCRYMKGQEHDVGRRVDDMLQWLNLIHNIDWIPPALLFLARDKEQPDPRSTLWFFSKLERLAAYLQTCRKSENRRIARYARVLAALEGPHFRDEVMEAVALSPSEIKEMQEALDGNIYEMPGYVKSYLLKRLDSFVSDGMVAYKDQKKITIEHVLPQNIGDNKNWARSWPNPAQRDEWLHRIGNLVLLTTKLNARASNYDFEKKQKAYFGKSDVSSFALTTQVLREAEWTPAVVERRQKVLMQLLCDKWELGPYRPVLRPVA